MKIKKGFK